ncbi:MAG: AlpA family phage regulatory protein [Gammaproteobacteria bacterium]|nr:AlpA family phage regulatory protein [Gammaproteobacteria bacterium]
MDKHGLLTFSALLTLLGRRARQSIYGLMRRDASFPRPRQIGSEFSIGWQRGEVMEWLNSRPKAELNGLEALERRRSNRTARATVKPARQTQSPGLLVWRPVPTRRCRSRSPKAAARWLSVGPVY